MKILSTFALCLLFAVLLQSCKKDSSTDDTTTTATPTLQAYIGGAVWTPDTLSAAITYNAATASKVFSCTGTKSQKRIVLAVKQAAATNDGSFATGTYNVDATANVAMYYYTQQLTSAGLYEFILEGTAQPGSGTITVSSVDATNKTITGTYSFTSSKINYDANGNYLSITLAAVTAGQFNAMPYTTASN